MRIETLLQQLDFYEKLNASMDLSEVIALFEENGINVTERDLAEYMLPKGNELFEDDLEEVAGGFKQPPFLRWLRSRSVAGGGSNAFGIGYMGGR